MHVDMYIETSIRGPRRQTGIFGYVLVYRTKNGEEATLSDFEVEKDITPHEIEMVAMIRAMERLNRECEITVIAGNTYIENMEKNIRKWKENGWVTARGEEVKNKHLWQMLDELFKKHKVTFGGTDAGYQKWLTGEIRRRKGEQNV